MARPHAWVTRRWCQRLVCKHCGLLRLRNTLSEAAATGKCKWWDE